MFRRVIDSRHLEPAVLGDRRDGHGGEETARHVVQQLPAAAVVEARPACDRPGVVELPDERAHAMRLEAAPVVDRGFDGEALLDLAQPDEVLETVGEPEVAEHRLGDAGVAPGVLLMALDHRACDVEIGLVGEGADDVHRRVGLEAELRTEPRLDVAVVLEVAALVPDRPEVHVAAGVVVPRVPEAHRSGRGA